MSRSRISRFGGLLAGLLAVAGLTGFAQPAQAQNFPNRPVTLVVPYAAGGTPDILARLLTDQVGRQMEQPFVLDNRAGAGGNIGGQMVARAQADGYTLLVCAFSCSTAGSLYAKPAYDIQRDFAPVVMIGTVPSVMVVPAALPVKTFAEFVALTKRQSVNYASSGVGSSPHLASELLNQLAGIEVTHVPYRGAGQVTADLLANRVQLYFDNLPAALPNIKTGQLRPLLVAQTARSAAAPEIPTSAEAGIPDLVVTPWFGVFAPAATPEEVLRKLNAAFDAALHDPAVAARMKELGVDVIGGGRDRLGGFIAGDVVKWGAIIKERNIVAD
jgi:tripartite-type tricarboxylate transporter receptor subunit TctC